MKKISLQVYIAVFSAILFFAGSAVAMAAHSGGDVPLLQANGSPVTSATPYSPKATCARACHISSGDIIDFAGHDYGSGDKYSTHVQGVLASSDSSVTWEASQTKSFAHGVSVGKHMNQGRNETYTNAYRAQFGDLFFTSTAGMYGKY